MTTIRDRASSFDEIGDERPNDRDVHGIKEISRNRQSLNVNDCETTYEKNQQDISARQKKLFTLRQTLAPPPTPLAFSRVVDRRKGIPRLPTSIAAPHPRQTFRSTSHRCRLRRCSQRHRHNYRCHRQRHHGWNSRSKLKAGRTSSCGRRSWCGRWHRCYCCGFRVEMLKSPPQRSRINLPHAPETGRAVPKDCRCRNVEATGSEGMRV